jgi:hypothetical protein
LPRLLTIQYLSVSSSRSPRGRNRTSDVRDDRDRGKKQDLRSGGKTRQGREPIKREALAHVRFEARNGLKLDIATCLKSASEVAPSPVTKQKSRPKAASYSGQMIVDQVAIKTGSNWDIAAPSDR